MSPWTRSKSGGRPDRSDGESALASARRQAAARHLLATLSALILAAGASPFAVGDPDYEVCVWPPRQRIRFGPHEAAGRALR
jgi:hypothetical protein